MATLFTLTNGMTFLQVNSAAGGANVVFTNPDGTFTTIFLTTAQVRQPRSGCSNHRRNQLCERDGRNHYGLRLFDR